MFLELLSGPGNAAVSGEKTERLGARGSGWNSCVLLCSHLVKVFIEIFLGENSVGIVQFATLQIGEVLRGVHGGRVEMVLAEVEQLEELSCPSG